MSDEDNQDPSAPQEGTTDDQGQANATSQSPESAPTDGDGNDGSAAPTPKEGQTDTPPRKYAGKFDSVEELEKGYSNLETKLGSPDRQAPTPKPKTELQQEIDAAMAPHVAKMEEVQLSTQFGDAFSAAKPHIDKLREGNPSLTVGQAFQQVTEIQQGLQDQANLNTIQDAVADDKTGESAAADAGKSTTVGQGSTQPSKQTGITPADVREMSDDDYNKFIASPAGEEYLAGRASGEIPDN